MSTDGTVESRRGFLASWARLAASSSTLVCFALPALLVTVGAGAALSSLMSVFPQVVWLSEHEEGLFAAAGLMLADAGVLQWRNRSAPCATDPSLRGVCLRARRVSARVYAVSVGILVLGGWFAFGQPYLFA